MCLGLRGQINALHDAYSSLVDAVEAASKSSLCVPFGSDTAWQGLTTAAKAAQGKLGQDVSKSEGPPTSLCTSQGQVRYSGSE